MRALSESSKLAGGKVCLVVVDKSTLTEETLNTLRSFFERAAAVGCAAYICVGEGSIELLRLAEESACTFWIDNYIKSPDCQFYLALDIHESHEGGFLELVAGRFSEVIELRYTANGMVVAS